MLCRHYYLLVRLGSSAECVRRRRVTGAVPVTSSLCVRSACCWVGSCWLFYAALLAFIKASMAKSTNICSLEPLLACILTCIDAALARASKNKGHDHVRIVRREVGDSSFDKTCLTLRCPAARSTKQLVLLYFLYLLIYMPLWLCNAANCVRAVAELYATDVERAPRYVWPPLIAATSVQFGHYALSGSDHS